MKPMKAFKYVDHKGTLPVPFVVQPKLDGHRCLYQNGYLQSQDEHFWNNKMHHHIKEVLEFLPPNLVLDGELYRHGWTLQQIGGAGGVARQTPTENTFKIEYHIFDGFMLNDPMAPFSDRWLMLQNFLVMLPKPICLVQTVQVDSFPMADSYYANFQEAGYEGIMYRDPRAHYGHETLCGNKENRWKTLLKRKEWMDEKFLILDFKVTKGDKGEMGFQMLCVTDEGVDFCVGSGLSDAEIIEFANNPPVSRLAHVRYERLSEAGRPLKPSIEAIE